MPDEPHRGPGRPSKLTPEVEEKIVLALRGGNFRQVASGFAGVPYRTFSRWMRQARMEPDGPFGNFGHRVIEAERSAEIGMVAVIVGAARAGDARHAEWWLERKSPARWSRRIQVTIDEELTAFLAMLKRELDDVTYRRVLRIAARKMSSDALVSATVAAHDDDGDPDDTSD